MTTEKMNVHKALAELKILDDRIIKAINSVEACISNKHSNTKVKGVDIKVYTGVMKSSYDKATDLIKRREAIKRAVVLSNAVTKVTVADKEYTVAEAIEMKNHGMDFKKLLKEKIKEWQLKHDAEKHGLKTMEQRLRAGGCCGGRYTYQFVPTSIGTIGEVICSCGEKFTFQDL